MKNDNDYTIDYRRGAATTARVNGIHCRRNKRWSRGTGRGARMASLRAIVSCLALALASLVGVANASPLNVTIDYATVGNPGNAWNPATGKGAVSYTFTIAKYETSNTDYVKFLNTVDASGSNALSLYNSSMTSDTRNGGIIYTATASPGSKYTVRSGYDLMPVNYVSWFSAARFANWLNNGQGNGSTETGAYTLNGQLSGSAAARNAGATVYLPNIDEFTKAAYYSPSLSGSGGYYTFAFQSNSVPTASGSASLLNNVANYGGTSVGSPTTGVVAGNSYPNASSFYGLFNAYGNVVEYTESVNPTNGTQVAGGGASWRLSTSLAANWGSDSVRYVGTAPSTGDSFGFRVAAVPEPGAMMLAAVGLGGAAGGEYLRRRRRKEEIRGRERI